VRLWPWLLKLFGFKDETGTAIKVNSANAGGAVGVMFLDGKLEKIAVGRVRVGTRHVQQVASSIRNGCEFARSDGLALTNAK